MNRFCHWAGDGPLVKLDNACCGASAKFRVQADEVIATVNGKTDWVRIPAEFWLCAGHYDQWES